MSGRYFSAYVQNEGAIARSSNGGNEMPVSSALSIAIAQWVQDLEAEQHSPNTVASHRYAIRQFARWLADQPRLIDLETLTTDLFVDYVKYLKQRRPPLEDSTILAYSGVLVRWLQHLLDDGELAGIPNHRGVPVTPARVRRLLERLLEQRQTHLAPRIPDLRRLPAYYDEALQTFLQRYGGESPEHFKAAELRMYLNLLRNRALVATLFSSGGRVNEVVGLDVRLALLDGRVMESVAIIGKGRKRRSLRLDDFARMTIAAYLTERTPHYLSSDALFISHGPKSAGERLSDVTAWRVVKEAANALADERMLEGADQEEVKALRDVSPHSLRHYLAQAMLDEGADYKDITAILGHSSSVVTEQFYARLDDDRVFEVADTFAPRPARSFQQPIRDDYPDFLLSGIGEEKHP